jgi:hypothetical protein
MKSKVFISCDEATTICDKNQYDEASLLEKIKLNIHFIRCKFCKMYTKHNTYLTRMLGIYSKDAHCGKEKCLSDKEKLEIQKEVEKRIAS